MADGNPSKVWGNPVEKLHFIDPTSNQILEGMSEVNEIDIFNGLARMGEVSFGINDLWAETLGETRVSG